MATDQLERVAQWEKDKEDQCAKVFQQAQQYLFEHQQRLGNIERYRHYADPVSILDRSSHMSFKLQPPKSMSLTHDYAELAGQFTSTEDRPASTTNPDGTTSLIG